jgi:two-component system, NarL family, sensor histidine kinase DesK
MQRSFIGRPKPEQISKTTARDVSGALKLNWEPYLWVFFLCDLFVPLSYGQPPAALRGWLIPTVASLPIFLALYARQYRMHWHGPWWEIFPIALIAYALLPFNPLAIAYLGYAAMFAPYALPGLIRPILFSFVLLALYAIELAILRQTDVVPALAWALLLMSMSCISGFFRVESNRKSIKLSHLAALEERERIGQDLHDLLGQTLSLIALKSELAAKLLLRNPASAAQEMTDVMTAARESLKQVRAAVAGIRFIAVADEVESARQLLQSSNIELNFTRNDKTIPAEVETVLGMVIREAVTNIHRHSSATSARIQIAVNDSVELVIADNGCGGATVSGNGLTGIQERLRSLGGYLQIDSAPGHGTVLRASLQLALPNPQPLGARHGSFESTVTLQ